MRSLRNSEKILERILKNEPGFLNKPIEFAGILKSIPEATKKSESENNDQTSFIITDKESDSFDEDFFSEEASVKSAEDSIDLNNKKPIRSRAMNLLNPRKRPEKYFKKGFDIKNLNVGIFIEQNDVTKKKIKKRKTRTGLGLRKPNFLHEAFSQKQLMGSALLHENITIFNHTWKRKSDPAVVDLKDRQIIGRSIEYLETNLYDPVFDRCKTVLRFRDDEAVHEYFSGCFGKERKQKEKVTRKIRDLLAENSDSENLKRAKIELEEIVVFMNRKKHF